jgi:hypothetical protein
MSNVVIMNLLDYVLLGAHQAGTCRNAFHLQSRKCMVASTAIFLFGWAAASHGERRQPFAIAGVEKWHGLAV